MFTDPEKLEIRKLVEAGVYIRTAIRAIESAMAVSTTSQSRPLLVSLMHPLLEADEGAAACLGLLAGAIVARGEAEKIALRLEPRDVFLEKARIAHTEALEEGAEAELALAAALDGGILPMDPYLSLALFNVKRCLVRLRAFNKTLPFQDPLAWEGVDPILQRDGMTDLWRSGGQYLYDALSAMLDAYSADPLALPVTSLVIMKDVLAYGWLIEDDLQKATARYLGIAWVPGENPLQTAQQILLEDTSPRFQFMLTYAAQLLLFDPVQGRPALQKKVVYFVAKATDAWKRADYAAALAGVLGGQPRR